MGNNEKFNPLTDHLILQNIFSNLTLSEVKVSRLVCHIWEVEGALNFRHRALAIHVNPRHMTYESRMSEPNFEFKKGELGERKALRDFLVSYKLNHNLHLSLLDYHPWLHYTPNFVIHPVKLNIPIVEPFYNQENNLNFGHSLLANYFPKTAPFIKELRLEMMLKRSCDLKILEKVLEAVEQYVEKFSFEPVKWNHGLLFRLKSKEHNLSKIRTLSIMQIFRQIQPPAAVNLLSLFPNISFLDLVGLRSFGDAYEEVPYKINKLLIAASQLKLKLHGIHAAPWNESEFQAISNYSRENRLKSLYLNVHWIEEERFICRALEEIIRNVAPSLERFDLTWSPRCEGPCPQLQLQLLKNLKSFTYVSKFMGAYEYGRDGIPVPSFEGQRLWDCFGLAGLFWENSGKTFEQKFPFLESLSIILVEPGDGELWAEIFPPETRGKCISSKLKTLVVTFVGECESEEIQKFPRSLFPKLRHFRHGKWREEGNKLLVCHHEYDSERRLIRKWSWLAAVKKFIGFHFVPGTRADILYYGNYFYTIREKFRLRLGDHGFWDTWMDLERKKFHEFEYNAEYLSD